MSRFSTGSSEAAHQSSTKLLPIKPALPYGTYHVAAAGETSWYDYARFVLEAARKAWKPLRAGPESVLTVTTAAFPVAARRPANSRLDTSLFRHTFGLRLPPWQDGVLHVLRQFLQRDIDA